MKIFLINFLKIYINFISIFMCHNCRFYPSCSSYFLLSIKKFNFIKSLFFCLKRIIKCNCFFSGGYDPVP